MSEATQYNTYCESHLQLPVTEVLPITNSRGRSGYLAVRTLVKTADGHINRAKATRYWVDDRPAINSMLVGSVMLAITTAGVEMCFERFQLETRPGDPKQPSYIKSHLGKEPWRVRVFGKVVSSSPTTFTVAGQTFLVTGASKFTVQLTSFQRIPSVPAVGEFAGGSGIVQSISKSPPLLVVKLESLHVGVATQTGNSDPVQAPQPTPWMTAFQGDDIAENPADATLQAEAAVDDTVQLTSINSFCETTYRFPIFASERSSTDWTRVQSKTLTTDGSSHVFYLNLFGMDQLLPRHSIATITAAVALDDRQILMASTKDQFTFRPGNPLNLNYKSVQILKQPWRIRAAGRVVASQESEWVMAAVAIIGTTVQSVLIRFMIPSSEKAGPRWVSYRSPSVGTFASGRGFVEQVSYGSNSKFVVTLESATNPIASNSVVQLSQTTAAREDWLQAWQTPPPDEPSAANDNSSTAAFDAGVIPSGPPQSSTFGNGVPQSPFWASPGTSTAPLNSIGHSGPSTPASHNAAHSVAFGGSVHGMGDAGPSTLSGYNNALGTAFPRSVHGIGHRDSNTPSPYGAALATNIHETGHSGPSLHGIGYVNPNTASPCKVVSAATPHSTGHPGSSMSNSHGAAFAPVLGPGT